MVYGRQTYKPRFLILKGVEVLLFDNPPLNITELAKPHISYKIYQTMFRVVKESEVSRRRISVLESSAMTTNYLQTVDSRQHCFLLQSAGHEPRYLSFETRQELLRLENSWNCSVVNSVIKLGRKTFPVSHLGKSSALTLDWNSGFSLTESTDPAVIWNYKFSQLRGSR